MFTNYVDKILAFFDHLPPCVDIFYGMNIDKTFFGPPTKNRLVNVVCERPQSEIVLIAYLFVCVQSQSQKLRLSDLVLLFYLKKFEHHSLPSFFLGMEKMSILHFPLVSFACKQRQMKTFSTQALNFLYITCEIRINWSWSF